MTPEDPLSAGHWKRGRAGGPSGAVKAPDELPETDG